MYYWYIDLFRKIYHSVSRLRHMKRITFIGDHYKEVHDYMYMYSTLLDYTALQRQFLLSITHKMF